MNIRHPDSQLEHGGRLDEAVARFGGRREDWLDLSTGLNPWPWPVPDLAPHLWARLPEAAAEHRTADAARACYGVPGDEAVVVANGSQALIQVLPRCIAPTRVAVTGFTYKEHARCWALAGHDVVAIESIEAADETMQVIIVTNPNNPDGSVTPREVLVETADRLAARGGLLVVDEAFCDVTPEASVARAAGRRGLCVLRSLGKFFGLGGVRVGFALCARELGDRITGVVGPWATSGPALEIAALALTDRPWQAATRRRLAGERRLLSDMLGRCGLDIVGATDLYVLARCTDAGRLWDELAAAHILTRRFPENRRWLRFGLPADEHARARLADALRGRGAALAAE